LFRRILSAVVVLALILAGTLTWTVNIQQVKAEPATIYVDDDNIAGPWDGTPEHPYQNITSGLEHAVDDDTIIVCPGTYYEDVSIDTITNLTIRSSSGPEATIINASTSTRWLFEIEADNITIDGFTLTGATGKIGGYPRAGIWLYQSAHGNFVNNIIHGNAVGIQLWRSNYTRIENNSIHSNKNPTNTGLGIWLWNASDNTIKYNNITNNDHGIYLDDEGDSNCTENAISYNNIFNNSADDLYNEQSYNITAEYNWWGTTNCSVIDSKIRDDEEGYGEVDFIPFLNAPLSRWSA